MSHHRRPDDPQKEVLISNKPIYWTTQKELLKIEGTLLGIADVVGDWREEILTCIDGRLRI